MGGSGAKAALDQGFGPSPGRMALIILALQVLLVVVFIATAQLAVVLIDQADIGSERLRAGRMLQELAIGSTPMPAADIGRLLDLRNARFGTAADTGKGEIGMPLPQALVGEDATRFIWTPRRLGTIAWTHLAPFRISLACLMVVFIGVLLWRFRNLTNELERRRHTARELAQRDSLTGLVNRFGFEQRLAAELEAPVPRPFALCYLDLDGFKSVNDSLGHAVGDECLKEAARRLAHVCGPDELVARLGGDEFAVLVDAGGRNSATLLARKIIASMAPPMHHGGRRIQVGVSIGLTALRGCRSPEALNKADTALYAAKAAGRGSFRWYVPQRMRA